MYRIIIGLASVLGATGIGLGAFAAHGLRQQLTDSALAVFQTGVLYHLLHAVVLLGIGLACYLFNNAWLKAAAILMLLGVSMFSGSLYLLVLTPLKLGIITPIGGVLLILGWLCLAISSFSLNAKKQLFNGAKLGA